MMRQLITALTLGNRVRAMARLRALGAWILSPATLALLILNSLLVVTGGAVRLTGSGLGCPTWPECTPGSYLPVSGQIQGQLHAWIEFGNRVLTIVLVVAAVTTLAAVILSGRRDLRLLATGQLLGVFAQGVLGGITVLTHLNPLSVASHFLLSTILIAAATSLYTRRKSLSIKKIAPTQSDIFSRAHIALTATVIALGTIVTGAGPHAGDIYAPRLRLRIHTAVLMHATAVATLIVLTLAFYLGKATSQKSKALLALFMLVTLAQGALGLIQYVQGVPELLVAMHLVGSVLVWIIGWRIWLSVQREEMDTLT